MGATPPSSSLRWGGGCGGGRRHARDAARRFLEQRPQRTHEGDAERVQLAAVGAAIGTSGGGGDGVRGEHRRSAAGSCRRRRGNERERRVERGGGRDRGVIVHREGVGVGVGVGGVEWWRRAAVVGVAAAKATACSSSSSASATAAAAVLPLRFRWWWGRDEGGREVQNEHGARHVASAQWRRMQPHHLEQPRRAARLAEQHTHRAHPGARIRERPERGHANGRTAVELERASDEGTHHVRRGEEVAAHTGDGRELTHRVGRVSLHMRIHRRSRRNARSRDCPRRCFPRRPSARRAAPPLAPLSAPFHATVRRPPPM